MANEQSSSTSKKRKAPNEDEKSQVFVEPIKYDCPIAYCERKFRREITLLTHILTDHRKIYNKIMNIVNDVEKIDEICNSDRSKQPVTVNNSEPAIVTNNETHSKQLNGSILAVIRRVDNAEQHNIPSTSRAVSKSVNLNIDITKQIKQSPCYHLQVYQNKTLGTENCSHIIVTVRYKSKDSIQEDVLFNKKTNQNVTPTDIVKAIDDIITTVGSRLVGISMDGAETNSNALKAILEYINQKGFDIRVTYNFTRWAEFISQHLPTELNKVLEEAIQFINVLKTSNSDNLCAGMNPMTKQILLHTNRYWLTYGNALTRLFEMRAEFDVRMQDPDWLCSLAYLADIFDIFGRFYKQLNEKDSSIFHVYSEIENMIETLKMDNDQFGWQDTRTKYRNLKLFLSGPSVQINPSVLCGIQSSLKNFSNQLKQYLPIPKEEIRSCEWIIDPFRCNMYNIPADLAYNVDEYDELIELRKNFQKKISYKYENLELFWIEAFEMYPNITQRALQYLLIFKNARVSELEFFSKLIGDDNSTLS